MLSAPARRGPARRYEPSVEGLEGRALLATGQFSLRFLAPSTGTSVISPVTVKGSLPDGSIDILDGTFNSANPVSIGTSSAGTSTGKVSFSPMTFTTYVGSQTGPIFQVLASGSHFNQAQLVVRDSAARIVATYDLGLVFFVSQQISLGDTPVETDTLVYGAVRYSTVDPLTNKVLSVSSWSQVSNAPTFSIPGVTLSSVTASATPGSVATTISLQTIRSGKSVSLRAHVASAAGVPPGTVTFYSGKNRLGSAQVGADGNAVLSGLPSGLKGPVYAIFSGEPGSIYAQSTTVAGAARQQQLFRSAFGRSMTQSEWVLTSIWLQQGQTPQSLAAIYRKLANRG
ncbi:MAG: Ig-like domain repeat protein [Isosphaeraceae bacterium]